jgi:hypothetical protein
VYLPNPGQHGTDFHLSILKPWSRRKKKKKEKKKSIVSQIMFFSFIFFLKEILFTTPVGNICNGICHISFFKAL